MSINNSGKGAFATELLETMIGTPILIGTLLFNPVLIIFDNLSATQEIAISVNDVTGSTVWKTFPAGEALVLDLRDKAHLASNFTFDIGTSFYGNGVSGDFSISYIYAREY